MKIKQIDETAHIAWSPASQHPIYLAAGTAAQQLDASFSTTAKLDLYSLDLGEPGLNMGLKTSIPTNQRFHKLVWGSQGTGSGVLVGGADQGTMMMFDAARLLDGSNDIGRDPLISQSKKHTGPVKALDFNPSTPNLLASGATNSEIYIWDLNNPATPMTPGSLSQPADEVTCLAWNRKVPHILASTFASRCVVWDLKKNEPIIKVSDSTSQMRCKAVAWHPDEPIQLCLASEDDRMPVIQLWDLRFATSPLKTFDGHQKGILSMSWCSQDSDLLLSCGKDNRVLIWNTKSQQASGEVLAELSTSSQWCFDAAWCPRNPAVIAAASFDGRVGVHSILGGRELRVQVDNSHIADSFPGMVSALPAGPIEETVVHEQPSRPPKWLRPHCGASFGFGGRLVTFGGADRAVHISQVVTEPSLVERSQQLEVALRAGDLARLCADKIQSGAADADADAAAVWRFLAANFSESPRQQLLQLLGYSPSPTEEVAAAAAAPAAEEPAAVPVLEPVDPLQAFDQLAVADQAAPLDPSDLFDQIGLAPATVTAPASSAAPAEAAETAAEAPLEPLRIATDDSVDGRLSKALLTGDLPAAVDICFDDGRYADALVLALAGPAELLEATRQRYFKVTRTGHVSRLIRAVVTHEWLHLVETCDVSNWKEALAAALTYADDAQLAELCRAVGRRLEALDVAKALLCYVCAGDLEKLVDCWQRRADDSTAALQELVEQVMVLRQAQRQLGRSDAVIGAGNLTQQLCRYAGLLAGQGDLQTALTYLDLSEDATMLELKERLQYSLGRSQPQQQQHPHQQQHPLQQQQQRMPLRPTHQQPSFQQPSFQQPSFQQSSYQQPPKPSFQSHYQQPAQQQQQPQPPMFQPTPPPASQFTNGYAGSSYRQPPQQPSSYAAYDSYHQTAPTPASAAPSWSTPAPAAPSWSTPAPPPAAPAAAAPPPPAAAAAVAPPPAPPAGAGGLSARSGLSLGQRSRVYVQDPSLYGGSAPRTVQSAYTYGDTSHFPANSIAFNPQFPAMVQPAPPSYQTPFQPAAAPAYQPAAPPSVFQPQPPPAMSNGSAAEHAPAPTIFNPMEQAPAPLAASPYAPPPPAAPAPAVEAAAAPPPPPPASQPPPGWNDPPQLSMISKAKINEAPLPEPITHPIFGTNTDQQQMPPHQQQQQQQQQQQPPPPPPQFYGAGAPVSGYDGAMLNPVAPPPMASMPTPVEAAAAAAPPPPVPQLAPLPPEHQIIHDVFHLLKDRCSQVASNSQMKRKLDDVSRKLDSLDDRLRNNGLSGNTLNGLHQIVQASQAGDFGQGLAHHTQLVSTTNFTEIGSFMPGIKVLLQLSAQLGVTAQ